MPDPTPRPRSTSDPTPERTRFTLTELMERFPDNTFESLVEELQNEKFKVLYDLANTTGARIYLTGGIIRDALTGAEPKDFDFVITMPNAEDARLAREQFESHFGTKTTTKDAKGNEVDSINGEYGSLQLRGSNFGVYKFYPTGFEGEEAIDIAFPRTEQAVAGSTGGSRDFDTQADATIPIEDDLSRRDFTINALTLDVTGISGGNAPELIDLFGGLDDLENKVLDSIGDPEKRLNESIDRILRAVRFKNKMGFEMTPRLEEAVYKLGWGDGEYQPALMRRKHDGSLTIPKEKIAVEFLKGFYVNPSGVIEDLNRFGLLRHIFPDLVKKRTFKKGEVTKRYSRNEKVRSAAMSDDFTDENEAIRSQSLSHITAQLRLHKEAFGDEADIDEMIFILFHELGKCQELAIRREGKPDVYDPESYKLGKMQLEGLMSESALYSMESGHKLRVHPEVIADMFNRYPEAISLLSVDHQDKLGEALNNDPRLVSQIHRTFPGLSRDPLWRVLQSDMLTTKHADVARTQLARLGEQISQVEKLIEGAPMMRKELFDGGALVAIFHLPPGRVVGEIEQMVTENAYYKAIAAEGYQTDQEVKRELFAYIVNLPEVREIWGREYVNPETINLFRQEEDADDEVIRRDILHALENATAASYLGESLLQAAEFSTNVQTLHERQAARVGFVSRFSQALSQRPQEVLSWLEQEFNEDGKKNKRKLGALLFPEVAMLRGCEQDSTYHSEGDVWVHTRKLFESADELGIPLTNDLAVAILYHDIGKPQSQSIDADRIRFIGHEDAGVLLFTDIAERMGMREVEELDIDEVVRAIKHHGDFYKAYQNVDISLFQVRNLLPNGEDDLLYQLVRCDDKASVPLQQRDSNDMFNRIEEHINVIGVEGGRPEIFDSLLESDVVSEMFGAGKLSDKANVLYQVYTDLLRSGEISFDMPSEDALERLQRGFLMSERKWTSNYVRRVLAPGARFIEKGIMGKRIGEIQNQIIEAIMGGEIVTVEDFDSILSEL
ncbi:HD domain-containing protein [candidate division WWE3 bacterium]|uniref:HD domain-containing protein n=1 Tax=candidate division WWE3 bacterium TaxID=2053526 RepID=A0A955LKG2_UNCKA|nr:HD domain-containing protein [candidate division WWE3 bacterium]